MDVKQFPHLRDLTFLDVDIKRVSLIVRSNVPSAHVQCEVRNPPNETVLYGVRFPHGWSIVCPLPSKEKKQAKVNFVCVGSRYEEQIERVWKVEDYRAMKSGDKPLSVEDKRVLKILEQTTTYINGRYKVGLLWKENEPKLPNNRTMAERRAEYFDAA